MLPKYANNHHQRRKSDDGPSRTRRKTVVGASLMFVASMVLLTGSLDKYIPGIVINENPSIQRNLSQNDGEDSTNTASIIAMQFNADKYASSDDKLKLVLDGTLQLVDCSIAPDSFEKEGKDYKNIHCSFCEIGSDVWQAQKENPSLYPHFGNILGQSEHCNNHRYSFPLEEIVKATQGNSNHMECGAFVFHQGKTGSSALMNAITIADPDGLVIAEHPAVSGVINACDKAESLYDKKDCRFEKQVKAMKDIIGVISQSMNNSNAMKGKIYFKLHPSTSGNINIAAAAFPECKRIFIYRDPNTVLTKHIQKKKRSTCVKMKNHPNQSLKSYLEDKGMELNDMTDEMVCSAYLASLLRSATIEHDKSPPNTSLILNYDESIKNMNDEAIIDILSNFLDIEKAKDPDVQKEIKKELQKRANGKKAGQPWNKEDDTIVSFSKKIVEANQMFLQNEIPTTP